jgi:hypothetical protein
MIGRSMLRARRKPIAVLCIALVVCAAFLPGFGGISVALFEPAWVLLPDLAPSVIAIPVPAGDEQPVPLASATPSRAPPPHV